jgi:two-component system LytT family response regulator
MNNTKNNPIRVILVDDEHQSRKTLQSFLQDYCPHVEIIGEADSVLSGYKLLQQESPDAIFLDIQMNDGTGFDLLNKIPNPSFQVIFTTAFDDFAIKAFQYNAVDYLLKPIDVDELMRSVKKIKPHDNGSAFQEQLTNLLETNKTGKFDKIVLSTNNGLHFLELNEIIRLQSEANYTTFYLLEGKRIVVAKTLKSFEELLVGENFFRPHQSHIINLKHVEKILKEDGGYLLMKDDYKIPISRSKKELFMNLVKDRFIQ